MEPVLRQLTRQHTTLSGMLRRTVEQLSDEAFARAPSPTAPPIGWHLWHIARWSDRFQATLANREDPQEIWLADDLPGACGLAPEELGVLQLGMGMDATKAQALPAALGRERFGSYLDRVLDALSTALEEVDPQSLLTPRMTIREYALVDGVMVYAAPQESTLLADILFHLTHSGRHFGSVEALRGLEQS